jgi:hypothetical protein
MHIWKKTKIDVANQQALGKSINGVGGAMNGDVEVRVIGQQT